MRSLVLVLLLGLALVLALWRALAPTPAELPAEVAAAARAAGDDRAPPAPADPGVARSTPEAAAARERLGADAAPAPAEAAPGVRGRLVHPAWAGEDGRVPLPEFVVRLMEGDTELARTTARPDARGPFASFELAERPRAPQSLVVDPPRGWVVLPARRFAPHRARATWEVELEATTVEAARACYRFDAPDVPWATAWIDAVDRLGSRVPGAHAALAPVALDPAVPAAPGPEVCWLADRTPSARSTDRRPREDWNSARLHAADVPRAGPVEGERVEGMLVAAGLRPGTWRLRVTAPGFRAHEQLLELRRDARVAVTLDPGEPSGAIVATLTSATGTYEHAAEVVLTRRAPAGSLRRPVVWSGDAGARVGTARIEGLPGGEYDVRVVGSDDSPWSPERVRVRPPAEVRFHLADTDLGRFAFRVLDASTRQPLESCDVELSLGGRRVKKYNQPCGATVLERYPLDGTLEWVVRSPGFLEARGGREAFEPAEPGGEPQVAVVLLDRDPGAPR